MKLAVVCLLAIGVLVYARPEEYTHKYDNIDVDQILHNERLLRRYVDCLLDKPNAKCPPEAVELKSKCRARTICDYKLDISSGYKNIRFVLSN